jgi:spore germination protein KC
MKNSAKRTKHLHKPVVIMLSCLLFLSGCWDSRDVEQRTNVVSIGIDQGEASDQVLVSLQIPIPRMISGGKGGQGGGGGGQPVKIVTAKGSTFLDGIEDLQHKVNQEISYGHTRVIAIGEEIARGGLRNVIDGLRREPQIRRMLWPIIVRNGKAADLLPVKTELKQIPAVYLMSMIENEIDIGTLPDPTLGHFYNTLSNSAEEPIMIAAEVNGKDEITISGLAVFRDDKLVGYLDFKETSVLLQVAGENDGGEFTFQVGDKPDEAVTYEPQLKDTKYDFSYKNGKVHIEVDVILEGEVTELTASVAKSQEKTLERLNKVIEQGYEKRASEAIGKLQKELRTDVLGFGSKLRAFHYGIWQKIDWTSAFPEAEVDVNYHVYIRSTGMETQQ